MGKNGSGPITGGMIRCFSGAKVLMHSQQIILFVLGKSVDATPRECGMGHCCRLGRGKRNDRVLLSSNHPVHGRDTCRAPRYDTRYTYTRTRVKHTYVRFITRIRLCAYLYIYFLHITRVHICIYIYICVFSTLLPAIMKRYRDEIETINRVRRHRLVKFDRLTLLDSGID